MPPRRAGPGGPGRCWGWMAARGRRTGRRCPGFGCPRPSRVQSAAGGLGETTQRACSCLELLGEAKQLLAVCPGTRASANAWRRDGERPLCGVREESCPVGTPAARAVSMGTSVEGSPGSLMQGRDGTACGDRSNESPRVRLSCLAARSSHRGTLGEPLGRWRQTGSAADGEQGRGVAGHGAECHHLGCLASSLRKKPAEIQTKWFFSNFCAFTCRPEQWHFLAAKQNKALVSPQEWQRL